MRRLSAIAWLAIAHCLSAGASHAQPIDLTGGSCADFTAMSEDDRNQISLWLAGYYAGLAQRPVLDIEKVLSAPAGLMALCAKMPQAPLVGPETRSVFFPPAP